MDRRLAGSGLVCRRPARTGRSLRHTAAGRQARQGLHARRRQRAAGQSAEDHCLHAAGSRSRLRRMRSSCWSSTAPPTSPPFRPPSSSTTCRRTGRSARSWRCSSATRRRQVAGRNCRRTRFSSATCAKSSSRGCASDTSSRAIHVVRWSRARASGGWPRRTRRWRIRTYSATCWRNPGRTGGGPTGCRPASGSRTRPAR